MLEEVKVLASSVLLQDEVVAKLSFGGQQKRKNSFIPIYLKN
jgi:hypothetical protein